MGRYRVGVYGEPLAEVYDLIYGEGIGALVMSRRGSYRVMTTLPWAWPCSR